MFSYYVSVSNDGILLSLNESCIQCFLSVATVYELLEYLYIVTSSNANEEVVTSGTNSNRNRHNYIVISRRDRFIQKLDTKNIESMNNNITVYKVTETSL